MNGFEIRLWLMVLGHLLADFTLQGWLANFKQKSWWKNAVPDFEQSKYRHDHIAALICHALYWAIIVCLPLYDSQYLSVFILANAAVHACIDNEKANVHAINLVQDQLLHVFQIVSTLTMYETFH